MSVSRPNSAPPGRDKGRRMKITENDDKVLGTITQRRREKSSPSTQFQSRNFKTYASNWTPMVNKPSNEQIYKERRELIMNWFDLWNDSQRKRFIDAILKKCRRTQLLFMQNWFQERIPIRHMDFTACLPRFLALYIFSFLDARSLCRASRVCWHWRFLTEQDMLWMPKCMKFGWSLPYSPTDTEYGAWKRHYIACTRTLHMDGPSIFRRPVDVDEQGNKMEALGNKKEKKSRQRARANRPWIDSLAIVRARPDWQHPDKFPKELTKANEAMMKDFNPNDPMQPQSALMYHNKFGQTKRHVRSSTAPDSIVTSKGLSDKAGGKHRALTIKAMSHKLEYDDLSELSENSRQRTLSERVEFENLTERRLMELIRQPWEPPFERITTRQDLTAGQIASPYSGNKHGNHNLLSMNYPNHSNPRIIFISSRVPAADLLHDAVMFGVIPLVYEYEGTTVESLLVRLDRALQGRQAQSVGIFTHTVLPSEICLVNGVTIQIQNLEQTYIRNFFETIALKILPPSEGGRCHIFAPLAAYEAGMEMLVELNILTGMIFSSPTGIVGNYNNICQNGHDIELLKKSYPTYNVNTEWFMCETMLSPPSRYFVTTKLSVWSNTADQVVEGIQAVRRVLEPYLEDQHKDVVSQVTGQIVFDALGQGDIQGVNRIAEVLVEGMTLLSRKNDVNPLEFLGKFLMRKAQGVKRLGETPSTLPDGLTSTLTDEYGVDKEVEVINNNNNMNKNNNDNKGTNTGDVTKDGSTEKADKDLPSLRRTGGVKGMTIEQWDTDPDKRSLIAKEIYASEVAYIRHLELLEEFFVVPFQTAITSNQPVIGAANVLKIFSDVMAILEQNRQFMVDMKQRITEWNSNQCLGDVFLKFTTRLKCYTNFLNNYHLILDTLERVTEQNPQFRAYLKRHERTPDCKMLTIQDIFLLPTRRAGEYVTLLTWFDHYTPKDHHDKQDIKSAIKVFSDMDDLIREMNTRALREKQLVAVQEKIVNCPALVEGNRYYIRQEDVSFLKIVDEDIQPHLRVYIHTETLGLFLFNDAMVVTRRTSKHFMFQRCVEYTYRFETSVGLARLRVADIPDCKSVKNAFKMWTPKRRWICAAQNYDAKYNWMTLLENAIKTALDNAK